MPPESSSEPRLHFSATAVHHAWGEPISTESALSGFYRRSHGHVAYVDESLRAPNQDLGLGNNTYYILAAVIISRSKLDSVRSQVGAIAAGVRWHTTNEGQSGAGRKRILAMCNFLAENSGSVVVIRTKIRTVDRDAEDARAECIEKLFRVLCESGAVAENGLIVFEQRQVPQRAVDRATINRLRAAGVIQSGLIVHFASPKDEPLLWAPDVVAWATRRMVGSSEFQFVRPLRSANHYQLFRA